MPVSKQKSNDGCLWLFLVGVLTIVGFAFGKAFLHFNDLVSIVLALLVSVFLVSRWFGTPSKKSLFTNLVVIIAIMATLKITVNVISGVLSEFDPKNTGFKTEERVSKSKIIEFNDSIVVYTSPRIWRDNYGNRYEGELTVRERDFNSLKDYIRNYKPSVQKSFWGDLYETIDKRDAPSLDLVIAAFRKINAENALNSRDFAEMLVSCIQDIPYSFVFQQECMPASNYEKSIRTILERCPDCCIGNVAYGIQNPVSFLQNLKGDCDTRTVLIYSLLKQFGYDVAILNSDFYKHSIIGLNIPAAGQHKKHLGKKYVVWETTNKFFELGHLSPNFDDMKHWNVVLTSK